MCVAALSGNACETWLPADKSFHRLMVFGLDDYGLSHREWAQKEKRMEGAKYEKDSESDFG